MPFAWLTHCSLIFHLLQLYWKIDNPIYERVFVFGPVQKNVKVQFGREISNIDIDFHLSRIFFCSTHRGEKAKKTSSLSLWSVHDKILITTFLSFIVHSIMSALKYFEDINNELKNVQLL